MFDFKKWIMVIEVLLYEYLVLYYDFIDELVVEEKFDWSFNDVDLLVDIWKIMM